MAETDIHITEILYDAPNGLNDNNFEFIEITNVGPDPVDLQGWTLDDGNAIPASPNISPSAPLSFPAGATGLLYNDNLTEAEFIAVYGPFPPDVVLIPVSGWQALNNSGGDEVRLTNTSDELIEQITYVDGSGEGESVTVSADDTETLTYGATPSPGDPVCLLAGTAIATPSGERAVEALQVGDLVLTADGRSVPVKWIGRQTVATRFGRAERLMPVRVRAGVLGDGLPLRDLVLTADHALMLEGVLVNAGALVGCAGIDRVPLAEFGGSYTVYHVETEAHDIILAEGAPAETFIDYAGRAAFDNYAEYVALHGEDRTIAEMSHPRILSARMLPAALRARLGGMRAA